MFGVCVFLYSDGLGWVGHLNLPDGSLFIWSTWPDGELMANYDSPE